MFTFRSIVLTFLISPALCLSPAVSAQTWYVSPDGDNAAKGDSRNRPLASINTALQLALPGDYVKLLPGRYFEDVQTYRSGTPDKPIKVVGPKTSTDADEFEIVGEAIIQGAGDDRIFQVKHSHIELVDFTIDGLVGDPDLPESYRDKLLFVHTDEHAEGIRDVLIKRLSLQNAGGECVRFRYFVQDSQIAYSSITNCGVHDFRFTSGKKNGEAIYIGTSFKQWADGKNPTSEPDESSNNAIYHNVINTRGNECVDIKEGSTGNRVYDNYCTGNLDVNSAGFNSAGNANLFYNNTVVGNAGSGFRFGSDMDGYGIHNEAYDNEVYSNNRYGFNIQDEPQARICQNEVKHNREGDYYSVTRATYQPAERCANE